MLRVERLGRGEDGDSGDGERNTRMIRMNEIMIEILLVRKVM